MKAMGVGSTGQGGGEFTPVRPGVYKAIVRNCAYNTGPSRRGFDIIFTIVEDGEYKNRTMKLMDFVNYDLTKGGFTFGKNSKLLKVFEEFGKILGKPFNAIDIDSELIAEKQVRCYIKVESVYSEKNQKSYSNVIEIYDPKTYNKSAQAPVASAPQTPPPAPVAPQTPPPAATAPVNDSW